MKLKKMTLSGLCIAIALTSISGQASESGQSSLNTASIMASSASTSCLDYKVIGTCFWLFCTKFGCKIRTSTKIKHYIPEVVVSSYNHQAQNPWMEMNFLSNGVKGGDYQSPRKDYTQATFKNVDVIGHPQGAISQMLNSTGYYCKSQTTPFVPYYLSGLDFLAWRFGVPEMVYPEALIPGMREIRANGDTWGNIYPRAGTVTQVHDYKASAVTAHRVADVVTNTFQPHVYIPIAKKDNQSNGEWFPPPVKEGDVKTHKWQQLHPVTSQSCAIFPDNPPSMLSENGSYAWALWRPYKCCKKRGQTFLYSIDWSN
ncbi:TIGR03756 family integrating conjugative element protein [Haemophilus influenzae]|jgi:integrating conjugative element protein, PFL_4710 family|uniref:TIGR03756 family integrating conjugative element protein n=1 Tax=Haemophilus TaxID=724 RepID=UPI00014FC602|nr:MULTISPECIES: TIGR03756 family integrating conjugative element protein [Haemophilus]EDK11273.1 conserved putative exported protein [Haemophilus influenzae PittII]MDU3249178.1 TIGR03756 family integrating conjugative element protein [Haemophilus parainfluenzae]MDU5637972.1 TIGR03756 family integrating conjugative element protein [Haemophilus parainfluenzae]PRI54378.1 TraU protein [Haemophilus influenzae]PRJ88415.1 TraU protein [Haemophilus influenzae]